jgi:hypothetical protein
LIDALHYAEKHGGHLPNSYSGEIEGLPGHSWQGRETCLRQCLYGLTRKNIKSLSHFFEIYGLKIEDKNYRYGRVENTVAISRAIRTLKETGKHGLSVTSNFIPSAVSAIKLAELNP